MATQTATASEILQPLPEIEGFTLAKVKGTTGFQMGGDKDKDEQRVHTVSISDFYMGAFPVTQQLWQYMMNDNPSYFRGGNRPVEQVSWNDICLKEGFLNRLNNHPTIKNWLKAQKKTNMKFRLPSEAEWEYAARGGEHWEDGFEYAGSNDIDEVAWYEKNSHNETKTVGLKAPNPLGLYDMSGNVWEWCADDWHDSYKNAPNDGTAWIDQSKRGNNRVLRGGGWIGSDQFCRVTFRDHDWPERRNYDIGFRLVLSLQFNS
jgi:formylglycine-generating enzyme